MDCEIRVQSGEFSDERSQKITKKHLKPVELQAAKIDEMLQQIKKEFHSLILHEGLISGQNSSIKTRVFVFGIISILIMSMSTFL